MCCLQNYLQCYILIKDNEDNIFFFAITCTDKLFTIRPKPVLKK